MGCLSLSLLGAICRKGSNIYCNSAQLFLEVPKVQIYKHIKLPRRYCTFVAVSFVLCSMLFTAFGKPGFNGFADCLLACQPSNGSYFTTCLFIVSLF